MNKEKKKVYCGKLKLSLIVQKMKKIEIDELKEPLKCGPGFVEFNEKFVLSY